MDPVVKGVYKHMLTCKIKSNPIAKVKEERTINRCYIDIYCNYYHSHEYSLFYILVSYMPLKPRINNGQ